MKENVKKYVKTSIAFLIAALVIEVSVLITSKVVKWDSALNGRPWAVAAHVHLLVLGVIWFLIQALLEKNFGVSDCKLTKPAYIVYLCGLGSVVALILYKGFVQLAGGTVIRGLAEGGAAISHTTLAVGLFLWAIAIWRSVCKPDPAAEEPETEE